MSICSPSPVSLTIGQLLEVIIEHGALVFKRILDAHHDKVRGLALGLVDLEAGSHALDGFALEARETGVQHEGHELHDMFGVRTAGEVRFNHQLGELLEGLLLRTAPHHLNHFRRQFEGRAFKNTTPRGNVKDKPKIYPSQNL